jgi:formylglycine-generating enzyme required for sulfatase activity
VWLLSEDEWYKAAFYKGGSADAGYWEYAVQTDDVPLGERPPGGPHSVNCISWVSPLGLPTMVGAYPEAVSAYGTYDQNGNLQEWIETPRPGADGLLRGSSFDWDVTQGAASVQDRYYGVQSWLNIGFRIGARAAYASNAAPVLRFEGAYAVSHDLGTVQWGHRIVELLGNLVSDLDDEVCGMAVVVVDRRCGEWQYGTVDPATGEATWLNLGNPTPQAALLLGPECRLRFIPNPATYPGGAVPGVSFRAWDRTSGLEFGVADTTQNGGETAFSAAVRTVLGRSNVAVVDDAGNEADVPDANSQRHGAVNHVYRISKYEVSNREYSAFLNAVAASDPLGLYPTYMVGGQPYALRGIERLGESGGYTYRCFAGREDLPACHISYFSAVRYVNWMHNGGGRGNTEDGAYTLLGGTSQPNNREPILRNPGTRVWLPSEDEWYKAAYYKGGGMGAGYWEYPVQTDLPPLSEPPPGGPHSVNCVHAPGPPGSPTNVGAYPDAVSAYGTHDQAGNVQEWLESPGIGAYTFARGGTFDWEPASAAASAIARAEGYAFYYTGFRVAGAEAEVPPSVPLALPPPPESGKPLVISWPSQLGWWYQLQEIGDLSQADKPEQWTNYLEPVEGNGGVMSREIVVSGERPVARFFRVLTLPP